MSYDPLTDFVGIVRKIGSAYKSARIPGIDFLISTMSRMGAFALATGGTAPTSNQPSTAWLNTASPSYTANGQLYLWDANANAYAVATPYLFARLLAASGGLVSSRIIIGSGTPANTTGNNDDFFYATDTGALWGPRAAGAWPTRATVPGRLGHETQTTDSLGNASLGVFANCLLGTPSNEDFTLTAQSTLECSVPGLYLLTGSFRFLSPSVLAQPAHFKLKVQKNGVDRAYYTANPYQTGSSVIDTSITISTTLQLGQADTVAIVNRVDVASGVPIVNYSLNGLTLTRIG